MTIHKWQFAHLKNLISWRTGVFILTTLHLIKVINVIAMGYQGVLTIHVRYCIFKYRVNFFPRIVSACDLEALFIIASPAYRNGLRWWRLSHTAATASAVSNR